MVLYSPTNVYVLARRFLCPVSCLTRATAQCLKKAVPSTTAKRLFSSYTAGDLVIKPVLRTFARSAGHSARRRTDGTDGRTSWTLGGERERGSVYTSEMLSIVGRV